MAEFLRERKAHGANGGPKCGSAKGKDQADAMEGLLAYDNLIARQFRSGGACPSPVHRHGLVFTMFIVKRNVDGSWLR